MRLRVLPLPSQPDVTADTYRTPFVLVVDDIGVTPGDRELAELLVQARQVGADGVLAFGQLVELPSVDVELEDDDDHDDGGDGP